MRTGGRFVALCAFVAVCVAAQTATPGAQAEAWPNACEIAYRYLAPEIALASVPGSHGSHPQAVGAAVKLCERIQPSVYESATDVPTRPRVEYTQSICFARVAHAVRDPKICSRVRTTTETPEQFRTLTIARQTRTACDTDANSRTDVPRGTFGAELVFAAMGYERPAIAAAIDEPLARPDLFVAYQTRVLHTIPDNGGRDAHERE